MIRPARHVPRGRALRWSFTGAAAAAFLVEGGAVYADEGRFALRIELAAHECVEDEPAIRRLFATQVEARLRRPLVLTNDAPAVLELGLTRDRDRVVGRATFHGVAGRDARVVEGTSCAEVVQAIAFIATTWLESEPEPSGQEPSRQDVVTTPAKVRSTVAPAPRVAPIPRARPKASLALGWRSGVTLGAVRRPALDIAVTFGYSSPDRRYDLRAGLRLARASGADVHERHYYWGTIPVDGCRNFPVQTQGDRDPRSAFASLAFGLCGRLEPGVFYAAVSHTRVADAAHALAWFDLGPGLRASSAIGKVDVEIEGFALVPITGYRIRGDEVTFEGVRTVVASLGIGVKMPIW